MTTGVELAIGKSTGAPFAEGIVGIGVNQALSGNASKVDLTFPDILTAFNKERSYTVLNEAKGGEETGGTGADNDSLRGAGEIPEGRGSEGQVVRVLAKEEAKGEFDIDGRLTGIYRASSDAQGSEFVRHTAYSPKGSKAEGLRVGGVFGEEPEGDVTYQVGEGVVVSER
jgi:hypothetical protein